MIGFERVPVSDIQRGDEIKLSKAARTIYFVEFFGGENLCVARPLDQALPDSDRRSGATTTVLDLSGRKTVERRQKRRSRWCTIESCRRLAECRGPVTNRWLCNAHAQRERQGYQGEADDALRTRARAGAPMQWLQENVFADFDSDACLLWPFPLSKGYGQVYDPKRKRPVRVHRFVLELVEDPPSKDHWAMHTCDTKHCVNPLHLEWVHEDEVTTFLERRGSHGFE